MRKVEMKMSVYLPGWHNCNLESAPLSSKKYCRFANKDSKGYYCSLFMERLDKYDVLLMKTHDCKVATTQRAGSAFEEEDVTLAVPPRDIMKRAIDEYEKHTSKLISQGYPASVAKTLVRQFILEE